MSLLSLAVLVALGSWNTCTSRHVQSTRRSRLQPVQMIPVRSVLTPDPLLTLPTSNTATVASLAHTLHPRINQATPNEPV